MKGLFIATTTTVAVLFCLTLLFAAPNAVPNHRPRYSRGLRRALLLDDDPPVTPPVVPPPPETVDCTITFDLFNAKTDTKVATLTDGGTIDNSPPCGFANIEAVVPCGDSDGIVTIELTHDDVLRRSIDFFYPYFFYTNGNRGYKVRGGTFYAGAYRIRAKVNGVWSPYTSFTLGDCSR